MKFFVYDDNFESVYAKFTTAKMALMCSGEIVADRSDYIRCEDETTLVMDEGVLITVGNSIFETKALTITIPSVTNIDVLTIPLRNLKGYPKKSEEVYIGPSGDYVLDNISYYEEGTDYYIYICDPTNGNDRIDHDEVYVISKNSTAPTGYTATNSRKIGGFHYGMVRRHDGNYRPINISGTALAATWQTNVYCGIVPNSVWTLLHRPKCSPEGMVFLNGDLWGDIYLSSYNGDYGLASAFGAMPLTSTYSWYGFVELAGTVNKRLASYADFCAAGLGSPAGLATDNTYAWACSTAEETPAKICTGFVPMAVSCYNVRDLVGNVWKYTSDIFDVETVITSTAFEIEDLSSGGIFQQSTSEYCGNFTGPSETSLRVLTVGGSFDSDNHAGRRAASVAICPWTKETNIGAWCVCDAL